MTTTLLDRAPLSAIVSSGETIECPIHGSHSISEGVQGLSQEVRRVVQFVSATPASLSAFASAPADFLKQVESRLGLVLSEQERTMILLFSQLPLLQPGGVVSAPKLDGGKPFGCWWSS